MAIDVIIPMPYECMHKSWPPPNQHCSIRGKVEIIIQQVAVVILPKYLPLPYGNNPMPHPKYLPDPPMDIGDSGIPPPILHKNSNAT
jgi:hypothetical protein